MDHRTDNTADADADLFRVLYPQLRRFAAVVGPDEVEPDDLVQEAVERVIRKHKLSDLDNPRAYLSRTIVNLASNHRRSLARARRAQAGFRFDGEVDPTYPSDLTDLMRLTPEQRGLVYLREVEGFTYEEIAHVLGKSERAVARATQRAKKQLGAELREELR